MMSWNQLGIYFISKYVPFTNQIFCRVNFCNFHGFTDSQYNFSTLSLFYHFYAKMSSNDHLLLYFFLKEIRRLSVSFILDSFHYAEIFSFVLGAKTVCITCIKFKIKLDAKTIVSKMLKPTALNKKNSRLFLNWCLKSLHFDFTKKIVKSKASQVKQFVKIRGLTKIRETEF